MATRPRPRPRREEPWPLGSADLLVLEELEEIAGLRTGLQGQHPGVQVQASYDKAWAAALTLIVLVMLLSLLARWIYRRYGTDLR